MKMNLLIALILTCLAPTVWTAAIKLSGFSKRDTSSCFPDYYWRDFTGDIPEDAVEGGHTSSGATFYVGQVYDPPRKALLPASIYREKGKALFVSYGNVLWTSTQVKILCSKHKNNFKWRPIEISNLHKLTDTHVVIGGDEAGLILYIGRVFEENSQVVGKIYKYNSPYKGLWVPSKGKQINFLSFDILTYNCEDRVQSF